MAAATGEGLARRERDVAAAVTTVVSRSERSAVPSGRRARRWRAQIRDRGQIGQGEPQRDWVVRRVLLGCRRHVLVDDALTPRRRRRCSIASTIGCVPVARHHRRRVRRLTVHDRDADPAFQVLPRRRRAWSCRRAGTAAGGSRGRPRASRRSRSSASSRLVQRRRAASRPRSSRSGDAMISAARRAPPSAARTRNSSRTSVGDTAVDPQHAAVAGGHQPLLLQVPQRLPDGAAADPEVRRPAPPRRGGPRGGTGRTMIAERSASSARSRSVVRSRLANGSTLTGTSSVGAEPIS